MITPPQSTPSYYAALLEDEAANFVISLLCKSFHNKGEISQLLVTSKELGTDIEAANELQEGIDEIVNNITDFEEPSEVLVTHNPLYLPNVTDIYEHAELDDDGNITKIDGFTSPFISMQYSFSKEDHPNLIDGKVAYQAFNLPQMFSLTEPQKEQYIS